MLLSRHSKCRAIIMLPLTGRGQHTHYVMMSVESEPNVFLDDEDAIYLVGWMPFANLARPFPNSILDSRMTRVGCDVPCRLDAFAHLGPTPIQSVHIV